LYVILLGGFMELELETTTIEQDRALKPVLGYLPEHLRTDLLRVLCEMDAKAINQGLVIDDCKRQLSILWDTLNSIESAIGNSEGRSSTRPTKVIMQSTPTRKHESDDWFRGSVGDPFD
jgi:hypothetical protein